MAAGNVGFGDDPLAPGCYSQLLFAEENSDGLFGLFSSDDNNNAPKMLCFGDYAKQYNEKLAGQSGNKTDQKPGVSCMASSSRKNINNKRNGSGTQNPKECAGAPRNSKKPKSENSSARRHAKGGKKEKLGERITALQQLVSPFGKTDTASVLHEALGYIRFLHDQVQVLSSPYLQPQPPHASENGEISKSLEKSKGDLRSRGLCLVPVDLTLHVADSNGADLWSSTARVDAVSSS